MGKKLLPVVVVVLFLLAFLAACGATAEPMLIAGESAAMPTRVPKPTMVVELTMVVEKEVEVAATVPASSDYSATGLASPPRAQVERMIIKNAEIDLLVADTDVALDSVTLIASEYGGYIVSSHTWFENEFKFATLRLGVPVSEFENVLRRLRGLAVKVQSETASGEDVTDQYVDLQSRLTNLQATRDRIREFLDKAENVEEALKVNEQLSGVEGQIEEIQGRMNYLKDRAAYSTIDVSLSPQRPTPTPSPTPTPTPTPTPVAWRPGETAKRATNVLSDILKGLVDFAIWVIIVLGPFAVPVLLVIWLIVWLRRRQARGRQPMKPLPPAKPPETEGTGS